MEDQEPIHRQNKPIEKEKSSMRRVQTRQDYIIPYTHSMAIDNFREVRSPKSYSAVTHLINQYCMPGVLE